MERAMSAGRHTVTAQMTCPTAAVRGETSNGANGSASLQQDQLSNTNASNGQQLTANNICGFMFPSLWRPAPAWVSLAKPRHG